ncbi:unnamed protein product [Closterium sp. Yama58-4]|nr:unnamed protein product [Closterium sp. Yama58-4]
MDESDPIVSHRAADRGDDSGSGGGGGGDGVYHASPAGRQRPRGCSAESLLLLFCAINMVNYIDRGAIASNGINGSPSHCQGDMCDAGSGIQGDFALSNFQDGLLATAFLVGLLTASPLFAHASKRHNPFRLIALGLLVWTLAVAGCGLSPGLLSLLLCRIGGLRAVPWPALPASLPHVSMPSSPLVPFLSSRSLPLLSFPSSPLVPFLSSRSLPLLSFPSSPLVPFLSSRSLPLLSFPSSPLVPFLSSRSLPLLSFPSSPLVPFLSSRSLPLLSFPSSPLVPFLSSRSLPLLSFPSSPLVPFLSSRSLPFLSFPSSLLHSLPISLAAPFIDDNAPPGKTAQWLATFYLCIPVGFALGYLYGGVAGPLLGWRGAFLLEAAFMLPFLVYTATAAPPPLKGNLLLHFCSFCCLSGGVAGPLLGWRGAFLPEALFMLPFVLYTATAAPPPLKGRTHAHGTAAADNDEEKAEGPPSPAASSHVEATPHMKHADGSLLDDSLSLARNEMGPRYDGSCAVQWYGVCYGRCAWSKHDDGSLLDNPLSLATRFSPSMFSHADGSLLDDSLSLARNEIFTINVLGYAAYTFVIDEYAYWAPKAMREIFHEEREDAMFGGITVVTGYAAYTFVIGAYAYWAPKAMREIFHEERADALFGGITVVTGVGGTLFGGLMLDRMGATIPNALLLQSRVTVVGALFCLLAFASPHILIFVLFMAIGEFFIFAIQVHTDRN